MKFDESLVPQEPKTLGVCSVCGRAFTNGKVGPPALCSMHRDRARLDRRFKDDPSPLWLKRGGRGQRGR